MSAATIPADPSLVLGHLVRPERIEMLKMLAELQRPQQLAESDYNSLVLAINSLQETSREMTYMGVDSSDLQVQLDKLREQLGEAAIRLGEMSIETENATTELLSKQGQILINSTSTSPLDFVQSQLKKLPLSSDALDMDVSYFRQEFNTQGQSTHASTLSSYIAEKTSSMVDNYQHNHADNVRSQVERQIQNHSIEGTLVITAQCTHRQSQILDPFILDARVAVDVWNQEFPDNQLRTDATNIYAAAGVGGTISATQQGDGEKKEDDCLHILDGATYGSTFVGMVHILQTETNESSQTSSSSSNRDTRSGFKRNYEQLTEELKKEMVVNLALSNVTGKYGVSDDVAESMKRLFSASELSVHCTLITEGIIPTIQSQTMKTSVQNLKPNPQEVMNQLAVIRDASANVTDQSMEAIGNKARMGQQFMTLNSEYLKSTVSALGAYDNDQNQVLDMNTFFMALTDFLNKAVSGDAGTPLQYSIRKLKKEDIARAYIQKFYPRGARNQEDALKGALGQI